jgi:hypothetical protein
MTKGKKKRKKERTEGERERERISYDQLARGCMRKLELRKPRRGGGGDRE